jgi:hypothetical protein
MYIFVELNIVKPVRFVMTVHYPRETGIQLEWEK